MGEKSHPSNISSIISSVPDVAVPTDFGLPYDDLILRTHDNINIRAYLLLQTKELSQDISPSQVDSDPKETDEEVSQFYAILNRVDFSLVFL
jgi:hypothetical protein